MQKRLDEAAGLNTAGFVSGYRGSPLGMVDQQLWKAKKFLDDAQVEFLPAINEDLAATACLGTQRVALDRSAPSMACSRCGTARARRGPLGRCAEARQRLRLQPAGRRAGGGG
jgi:TPP-dependent indolepyruvate ferredoxin oxidoreductase alpha subunit